MSSENNPMRFREHKDSAELERQHQAELEIFYTSSIGSNLEKLGNFGKYVPRRYLAHFISRYEIFKRILNVQGSIVECGVLFGGGLMTFAQLSSIFEPVNYQRRIIGFDTFAGFPNLHQNDLDGEADELRIGGLGVDSFDDLSEAVRLYDINRPLSHINKVELIKGDVSETIPKYIEDNPHTVVSLLVLDFDLYEPTKVALETFLPRIPKGGIIVFDELNSPNWPGETLAVLEEVGISNLRLERFPFDSFMCYAVVE